MSGQPRDPVTGPPFDPVIARPEEVELWRIRLPLRQPLRSAHGTETDRDVVLVRVWLGDGAQGWGECSALARPTYTHEYTAGAWAVLRDELVPAALAGTDAAVVGHPMAAAALEMARLDASLGQLSLVDWLGSGGRPVERTRVVGVPPGADESRGVDEVVQEVDAALDRRAAAVKLKVCPGWDIEPLTAVRSCWPDLDLAVDANGTYAGLTDEVGALERFGLTYIEQPMGRDGLLATAELSSRLATPIALDESVTSPNSAATALALGAGSVLNVKAARVGGPSAALECARIGREHGARCFVGGMLETGVGRACAVALASHKLFDRPSDLGPTAQYFDHDVTEPVELDNEGRLIPPTGAGIGVSVDMGRLEEVVVDRLVLSS